MQHVVVGMLIRRMESAACLMWENVFIVPGMKAKPSPQTLLIAYGHRAVWPAAYIMHMHKPLTSVLYYHAPDRPSGPPSSAMVLPAVVATKYWTLFTLTLYRGSKISALH